MTRLEEAGFVERRGLPENRRTQLAALADLGVELLAQAAPGHVAAVRHAVFDVLSPEQVRQLAEIAESVVEVLQQDSDTDDALPWRRR